MENEKKENTLESILKTIKAESRNFKEAGRHALFGINVGDILDDIIERYYNETLPAIAELSEEDKRILRAKLLNLIKKNDDKYDIRMFKGAVDYIKKLLNEKDEKDKGIEALKEYERIEFGDLEDLNSNLKDIIHAVYSYSKSYQCTLDNEKIKNKQEVLDSIEEKYNESVLDKLIELSEEELRVLVPKLDYLYNKNDKYDYQDMYLDTMIYISKIICIRNEEKEKLDTVDNYEEKKRFIYKRIFSNKTKPDTIA